MGEVYCVVGPMNCSIDMSQFPLLSIRISSDPTCPVLVLRHCDVWPLVRILDIFLLSLLVFFILKAGMSWKNIDGLSGIPYCILITP